MLLCRAYGLEADGTTWAEQGQNAVRQVYQKGWMEATALSAPMRMCRGAFYKSAFAVAGITVYDNTLYGGEPLSDHENCLRAARELHLCGDDADLLEIVTRGEAAQALHAILTQKLAVREPPMPVTLENRSGVNTNAFLLALRRVPQPILNAFNEHGWRYVIDYDYIADLSQQLGMTCAGATSYGDKTIYISEAGATLHEFGHFLGSVLNAPAEEGKTVPSGGTGCWIESLRKDQSLRVFRGLLCLLDHQQAERWENGMAASRSAADLRLL